MNLKRDSKYAAIEVALEAIRLEEELTTRDNPLRVGTKRIKISGVEYPFIAVSDRWRPALLHENRLVWIHHYRAIKGLRPSVFKVYYATGKVPYNRLPWTVDNTCFRDGPGKGFDSLKEAIDAATVIADNHEEMIKPFDDSEVPYHRSCKIGGCRLHFEHTGQHDFELPGFEEVIEKRKQAIREAAKSLGRRGGLVKSKKKAQASRENGKRGGKR